MIAVAALLALVPPAGAQQPLRQWLSEEKQIWTAPARLERRHLPWLAALGAATAGLIALDNALLDDLPDTQRQLRWGGRISRAGSFAGLLGINGGLYLAGAVSHNQHLKSAALAGGESAVHAFVVTYALKAAFARERPGTGSGDGRFFTAYDRLWKGDTSFPSGHAMTSWAVASAISNQYKGNRWVPWFAYGFAGAVSASRVAARKHHASDVFAGGAAGYFIGRLVSNTHDAKRAAAWRPRVAPSFDMGHRSAGLTARWDW